MAELYLVRHGQASLGTDKYDQLSEIGYKQAQILADYFVQRDIQFDELICGGMQRHRQTIEPIVDGRGVSIDSGWNEFDFEAVIKAYVIENDLRDILVSKDKRQIYRVLKKAMLAWSSKEIRQELPETWTQFTQRVHESAKQLTLTDAKRVIVVSSGGAIASFIGAIYKLSASEIINLNLQIRNASVHHFFFNEKGFQLSAFNSVSHLDSLEHQSLITYS